MSSPPRPNSGTRFSAVRKVAECGASATHRSKHGRTEIAPEPTGHGPPADQRLDVVDGPTVPVRRKKVDNRVEPSSFAATYLLSVRAARTDARLVPAQRRTPSAAGESSDRTNVCSSVWASFGSAESL